MAPQAPGGPHPGALATRHKARRAVALAGVATRPEVFERNNLRSLVFKFGDPRTHLFFKLIDIHGIVYRVTRLFLPTKCSKVARSRTIEV